MEPKAIVSVSVLISALVCSPAPAQDACAWTFRSDAGPSPRFGHAMAYDDARGQIILFGGRSGNQCFGDTWAWDGGEWCQVATTGPSPRQGTAMVYDSAREYMVLVGGADSGGNALGDTWTWDGAAWTLETDHGYGYAVNAGMTYDESLGAVLSVGGSPTRADCFTWTGSGWHDAGYFIDRRANHGLAYYADAGETILFGGNGDIAFDTQTWAFRNGQWQLRANIGPIWHDEPALVSYDAIDKLVLFGGRDRPGNYLDQTWLWDGAWSELSPSPSPSGRTSHAMAYDGGRKEIVLFGGVNPDGRLGDTWVFSCDLCEVDLTGDGEVNSLDVLLYLGAWSQGYPLADWNDDGIVNTLDFLAFLNEWVVGC